MSTFDDCEPIDWELTDEQLGLTPAARSGQLRHEARHHRRGVDRINRRAARQRAK